METPNEKKLISEIKSLRTLAVVIFVSLILSVMLSVIQSNELDNTRLSTMHTLDSLTVEKAYSAILEKNMNKYYQEWQDCEQQSEHMNDALADLLGRTDPNSYYTYDDYK